MKTFHEIAIQTDICGVDSSEELISLFTDALKICKRFEDENENSSWMNTDERSRSPQYFTSDNVTYCITSAESVDLQPVPLLEFKVADNQENIAGVFTQIRSRESTNHAEKNIDGVIVQLADNVRKISGDKDSPAKKRQDGKELAKAKMLCPFCSKEYVSKKPYEKHLKTHPELEKCDDVVDEGNYDNFEQESSGEEYIVSEDDNGESDGIDTGDDRPSAPKKKRRNKTPNKVKAEVSKKQRSTKKKASIKIPTVKKRVLVTHECQYCQQKFTNIKKFKTHVRKHERDAKKPVSFICSYCNKDCKSHISYKRHVVTHTKEKAFPCHLCEKAFSRTTDLKIHIRRHTNEKPYKCSHCDKRFVKKWAMDEHVRIHTGEKPYKCDICKKSFRFKNVLKTHQTTHTGVHPYNCHICGQGFNKTHHLEQHIRTHTGEKPFVCKYCNKAFISSTNWKQHVKKHVKALEADSLIAETETSIASNELISSTQSTIDSSAIIPSSPCTLDSSSLISNNQSSIGMCSSALNTPTTVDNCAFMEDTQITIDRDLIAKVADTVGCTKLFGDN